MALTSNLMDEMASYADYLADGLAKESATIGLYALENNGTYVNRRAKNGYRRSFRIKRKYSKGNTSYVLYSQKNYRLTHLLENGHRLVNGEFTNSFPHWIIAENRIMEFLKGKGQ